MRLIFLFFFIFFVKICYSETFEKGVEAFQTGDFEVAEKIFKPLAENGNAAAQHAMGVLFEKYENPESNKQAAFWYEFAVRQGYLASNLNLGLMYFYGTLPQDYQKSYELFIPAAEKGFSSAQEHLGSQYLHGVGVEKNYSKAFKWLKLAAESGRPGAQGYLGYMYMQGLGTDKNIPLAVKWLKPAAEAGFDMFQHNYAVILEDKWTKFYDPEEAVYWYKKAAEQKFESSILNLGLMYSKGIGVKQNFKIALMWFTIASELGLEDLAEINIDNVINKMSINSDEDFQKLQNEVFEMINLCADKNFSNCP